MHLIKAAFVSAGFFAGFVFGKDIAVNVLARVSAGSAVQTTATTTTA